MENETIDSCISESFKSEFITKEMWRGQFVNCNFWPDLNWQQLFVIADCTLWRLDTTSNPALLSSPSQIYFMCSTEICSPRDGPCAEGCFGQ